MDLKNLKVVDPRRNGEYKDPFVTITVTEAVQETGGPIQQENGRGTVPYRLVPCGPFFAAEFHEDNEWYDIAESDGGDYGVLNKIGLVRDQLFPVEVVTPEETLPLAISVQRMRRMLRGQYGERWQIKVNDGSALRGRLKWRLELRTTMCYGGATPRADVCHRTALDEIVVHNTHLPMCSTHLRAAQNEMRQDRINRKA